MPNSGNGVPPDGGKRRLSYSFEVIDPDKKVSSVSENAVTVNGTTYDKKKGPLLYRTGDNPPFHLLLLFGFQVVYF